MPHRIVVFTDGSSLSTQIVDEIEAGKCARCKLTVYNILAIPVAAGILYPNFGIILRPEVSALLMSASSIIVATNAVLLKRTEKNLVAV